MATTQTVVFDLDDTLADFTGHKAAGGTYFAGVQTGAFAVKSDMLRVFNEYVARGIEAIIVTARPPIMRDATVEWVQQHIGDVPVYMTDNATRRPDSVVKREIVSMLQETRTIVAAFDDKATNIAMFAELGIEGVLV